MGIRAFEHPAEEHAGKQDIVDELCSACHDRVTVNAVYMLANVLIIRHN